MHTRPDHSYDALCLAHGLMALSTEAVEVRKLIPEGAKDDQRQLGTRPP